MILYIACPRTENSGHRGVTIYDDLPYGNASIEYIY